MKQQNKTIAELTEEVKKCEGKIDYFREILKDSKKAFPNMDMSNKKDHLQQAEKLVKEMESSLQSTSQDKLEIVNRVQIQMKEFKEIEMHFSMSKRINKNYERLQEVQNRPEVDIDTLNTIIK